MIARYKGITGMGSILSIVFCSLLMLCFFSIFLCFESVSDEEQFERVLDLMEAEKYAQVIEIMEHLIPKIENPEKQSKSRYMMATCYRNLGKWGKAISYYELSLTSDQFIFADMARLHIATGHRRLYNYGAAIKWYESILEKHPTSSINAEALYYLAESYYTIDRYEDAIEYYEKFTANYPEEIRYREAGFKIGKAYQGLEKWKDSFAAYQKVLQHYTDDEIAKNAANNIKYLIFVCPKIRVTREDRMYYSLGLYYSKQYEMAREEFEKIVVNKDELSAKASYFIAESYYKQKNYKKAVELYTSVIRNYPKSEYASTSQYNLALCYNKIGKKQNFYDLLVEFSSKYPNSKLADDAAFEVAEYHRKRGQYRKAIDAYSKMAAAYPRSRLADDALWNMDWHSIKLKDSKSSSEARQRLLKNHPKSKFTGSTRFWLGVNYERDGKWQVAAEEYRKVMNDGIWYYSDRAKKRLERLVRLEKIGEDEAISQYKKLKVDGSVPKWQNSNGSILPKTKELIYLRIFDDALNEFLIAEKSGKYIEKTYYNLSMIYNKMGDFNNSWRFASRLADLPGVKANDGTMPRQLYRMLHPLAFRETVLNYAKEYNVDPLLVMALILEESRFDPKAISWVGALGLIQVMPPTGAEIAQKLNIRPYKTEMLHHPETNIRMGTWYLSGLIDRLGKHVKEILDKEKVPESEQKYITKMLAVGAYNCGESRIRGWVKRYGLKDIDEFVENIPIPETKRYIKKVCHSYEVYKSLGI